MRAHLREQAEDAVVAGSRSRSDMAPSDPAECWKKSSAADWREEAVLRVQHHGRQRQRGEDGGGFGKERQRCGRRWRARRG
jgi:hypothetical protein